MVLDHLKKICTFPFSPLFTSVWEIMRQKKEKGASSQRSACMKAFSQQMEKNVIAFQNNNLRNLNIDVIFLHLEGLKNIKNNVIVWKVIRYTK